MSPSFYQHVNDYMRVLELHGVIDSKIRAAILADSAKRTYCKGGKP